MPIPKLPEMLVATSSDDWNEPIRFFVGNKFTPDVFPDGTHFEIEMNPRGVDRATLTLSSQAVPPTVVVDGNCIAPLWPGAAVAAAVAASGTGVFDFLVREISPGGETWPRLSGTVDFREVI